MESTTVDPIVQDTTGAVFVPEAVDAEELVSVTSDSITRYSPEVQALILKVASEIDPLQLDKILAYGSTPLIRTYESAGQILKAGEGTTVDQEVLKMVTDLAEQVNKGQEELNIAIQEPNWMQRLLMSIFTSLKEKQDADTKLKAITCYKLLVQLREKCEKWHAMLQENWCLIQQSIEDDMRNGMELEQYVVAGLIALERIEGELSQKKLLAEQTGSITDKVDSDNYEKGVSAFRVVILNLKKSLAAYGISLGQLSSQKAANENIQIAVSTQKRNSIALTAQQLRNALLEARNRQVMEGQRSVTTLNSELMKKVAASTVLTAEESEKVLLSGVYTVEAALEAAQTVIKGCEAIKKARQDRAQNVAQEMAKLESLVEEISPFVSKLREETESADTTSASHTPTTSSGLSF